MTTFDTPPREKRDRAGCGLALVADETIRMALARRQQVDGRIGLKIDLVTHPQAR